MSQPAATFSSFFGEAQTERRVFTLPHDFTEGEFDELLLWSAKNKASDLTIQSGDYIFAQIQGLWQAVTDRRLETNEVERICTMKYGDSATAILSAGEPLDFRMSAVLSRDNVLGFRANATRCRVGPVESGVSVTARSIPGVPPPWSILGIEPAVEEAFFPRYGMVLVCGTTGSGKSTLMASSIRRRLENAEAPVKIITFEEPVEYVYDELGLGAMPLVSQVEIGVGMDLREWLKAGPNAMRRKADVIITGEMRDEHSVRTALEVAESGHSVLATIHVNTPAEAVSRVYSFFPEHEQPSVASKLRAALRLVVAQKLVRNTAGTRTAFRSWAVFDREVKAELGRLPHHAWERQVRETVAQRDAAFEHTALQALAEGRIGFETYCEVADMTAAEAIAFAGARGVQCQPAG